MSLTDDSLKLRKKRLLEEEEEKKKEKESSSFSSPLTEEILKLREKRLSGKSNDDIAPFPFANEYLTNSLSNDVLNTYMMRQAAESEVEEDDGYFKKSKAFDDGYQVGDLTKASNATKTDILVDLLTGVIGMGEDIVDFGAGLVPYLHTSNLPELLKGEKYFGDEYHESVEKMDEFIAKDLYDEENVARTILGINWAEKMWAEHRGIDNYVEGNSVLGEKSDSLVQSAGQLGATVGLQAVGVPWWLTTGTTAAGGEMEEALKEGATHNEALASSAIAAGAEILTERIGGIKFGGKTLSDSLIKPFTSKISNKLVKALLDAGIDAVGEGAEEYITEIFNTFGDSLYKEEDFLELMQSEEYAQNRIDSFVGGMALGGMFGAVNTVTSNKPLSESEQKVVDKVYNDRLEYAEKEKGKKLTSVEKEELYDDVVSEMDRGKISMDTIEEVLGGDSYKAYKDTVDSEEALKTELEELRKMPMGERNDIQNDRLAELKAMDFSDTTKRDGLKAQLRSEVYQMTKGSRLGNSYDENYKRTQSFTADLSKYKGKAQEFVKSVVESGKLNDSKSTHNYIDFLAKSAEKLNTTIKLTDVKEMMENGQLVSQQLTLTADGKNTSFAIAKNAVPGAEFTVKIGDTVVDSKNYEVDYQKGTITFKDAPQGEVTIEYQAAPNGWNTNKGEIVLNSDTKNYLTFVAGHEITHSLENTKHYAKLQKALFDYAKAKGVYDSRRAYTDSVYTKQYAHDENYDKNIDKELTADLVGDYIFSDTEFVQSLYKQDQNIFKQVWDSIKHLVKMATAGSTEARELEKAQMRFEQVWREGAKDAKKGVKAQDTQGETQFSLVDDQDTIDFLENQEHITVYKAMSQIDGKNPTSDADIRYSLSDPIEKEAVNRFGVTTDFEEVGFILSNGEMLKFTDDKHQGERLYDHRAIGMLYGVDVDLNLHRGYNAESNKYLDEFVENGGIRFFPGNLDNNMDAGMQISASKPLTKAQEQTIRDFIEWKKQREDNYDPSEDEWSLYSGSLGLHIDFGAVANSPNFARRGGENSLSYEGGQINADRIINDIRHFHQTGELRQPSLLSQFRYSLSDITDEQNERGLDRESEVKYSISNDTKYMDKAIALNNSMQRIDPAVMDATKLMRERVATRMKEIKDKGLVKLPEDIEGNTFFSNTSYGGSEENTTICPRSLSAEAFVDAVSEYLGRPLNVNEQIYISQDLQGRSMTPECTYCYVATDRKAYRAFLGEYIKQRDAVLQKLSENPGIDVSKLSSDHQKLKGNPKAEVSPIGELYKEFLGGRKVTEPMYKRFKMWVDVYKNGTPMIDASHLTNMTKLMGDIGSQFGQALKPQIVDAMKYAQSASWAKKRVSYVAYNGHILKWKQDRINKLNSHYGLRMYSFSDFHPAFVLENMQMITDASVRGLKVLGYTKDTDFVEIFAPSGMNINISTFGFEMNGVVAENALMGAEWEKAKELRSQYDNVGITFVATNDNLVNWALAQDWIDVVIPFHLVRTGTEVAKAYDYHDYTDESSDKKTKDWKEGNEKSIAPTQHNNDLETYMKALEANNLTARFERFMDNPNYMKLVNECRRSASESTPVQPRFNEDAINRVLAKLETEGYYNPIGGSVERMYEIAAEVGDSINNIAPTYSISDATVKPTMGMDITGDDVRYTGDIAPVMEAPVSKTETTVAKNAPVAPVRDDEFLPEDTPIKTVKDRLSAKLSNSQKELENNQKLREDSSKSYDEKISKLQAEYDSKKDKTTKVANNLLRRIEKLKRRKADVDAECAKRISDIESRISKTEAELQKDHTKQDEYERTINRINRILESDKAELDAEFNTRREELADSETYTKNKALELYNELKSLKKGVRASKQLGYLLDSGYSWSELSKALVRVSQSPDGMIAGTGTIAEAHVRESIDNEYENELYGIDEEYQSRLNELETEAETKRQDARLKNTRKKLQENIINNIKNAFAQMGKDFDSVLKNAKNLSTWATVDNTPSRVMKKSLGYKEGGLLADLTVNKVAQNETEAIKWLNTVTDRKNGLLAQLSKQYHIKPGSNEIAAAQMYAEGFYVAENDEIYKYGDAELAKDFPDVNVQNNIKGLVNDPRIRQFYDETLAMINESRTRNGYAPIPRLDNYYLHYRAMGDTFSELGLPFNPNDIRAKDLPTDLNGVTIDNKPGQPYFASSMHRTGKRTTFDLFEGMERYAVSAKNQIFHIDDIQTLRALRNYLADSFGQGKGLEGLDEMSDAEAQERIKEVFSSHMSTFAKFLNEEANIIAGKTALADRAVEGILGRRAITFLDTVNRQVGSNSVGYSASSAIVNFDSIFRAFAKTNKADFVTAFAQMVSNSVSKKSDGFAENSSVIIRRKGADRFNRTLWQKLSDPGYVLMGAADNIATELIARTKYNEYIRKGMDSEQANFETDKWVSDLMGDRSLGQMPQIFNSKMLGLVTKFQLEVRNNLDSMFYDTIQEKKASTEDIQNELERNAKTAAKATWTVFQLAVAQHIFGKAFEFVAGYNPSFDIIDAIIKALGLDDDEEDEDTALDNIEQGFLALLEDMPYASTFTGGRIPISNALPIKELITGEDEYGKKSRWETLGEIAPYYLLPGGYGQYKKTKQGLNMFSDDHPIAGSYTDSGNLRFPVDDTFGSRLQAGLFGQWSSKNAQQYIDEGRSPLQEKQIQELIDVGLSIQDYWKYRDGLKGLKTLAEKADYIDSLDLTTKQKNVLINNIADREEAIDLSNYDKYDGFEEFDFAVKNPEKYDFFKNNGISYDDYADADEDGKRAYTWAYENPGKYTMSKAFSDDFLTYYGYRKELNDIEGDKDANGETVSGSKKTKVINYINNMDLDYGQKIILFRSMYSGKEDRANYNADIVEYLNGRDDISYEDMVTILEELDMKVSSDGSVTWD